MEMNNKNKKWWKSKTLHFNAVISVLTVLEANFEFVKGQNPDYYIYIVLAVTMVNFYLRTITSEAIKKEVE